MWSEMRNRTKRKLNLEVPSKNQKLLGMSKQLICRVCTSSTSSIWLEKVLLVLPLSPAKLKHVTTDFNCNSINTLTLPWSYSISIYLTVKVQQNVCSTTQESFYNLWDSLEKPPKFWSDKCYRLRGADRRGTPRPMPCRQLSQGGISIVKPP